MNKKFYLTYQPIMKTLSNSYSRKYNLDVDDLMSEANLILWKVYLKNKDNLKFKFILIKYIINKFNTKLRKKISVEKAEKSYFVPLGIKEKFYTIDFNYLDFSREVKEVIELCYDAPIELFNKNNTITQSNIISYLRDLKWSYKKIENSFNEIRLNFGWKTKVIF